MKLVPLIVAILALAGCAVPQQPRLAKYNAVEYAPYAGVGTAKITGQAFAKTVGGDVKFAAGNRVWLYPVTSMTIEWYQTAFEQGKPMQAGDQRMMQHSKMVLADGSGNFEFARLPAGNYYLVSQISWGVPTGYFVTQTGAAVHKKVHVNDGESIRVILTPE
jgi:hypothetical protein